MQFALNYSHPAAELLRADKIDVDILKCPDWPETIDEARQLRPVYVHFTFQAGQSDATPDALEAAADIREKTGTLYINTHFAPDAGEANGSVSPDRYINLALADIRAMTERFGSDNVIIENIPYPEQVNTKPPLVADPEVIMRLIENTGCGFLLDLGHARRASEHFAVDPRRYIEQLPVHRLREMHITGLGYNASGRRTDHLPMREDDWELLEWALERIRSGDWPEPWAVACEYGGVGSVFSWRSERWVIEEQVPRMADMVRAAQPLTR
jgi:uncharacterized protein